MRPYRGKTPEGKEVHGGLIVHNAYDLNDGTHKPEPLRTYIEEQDITWVNEPNDKRWMHLCFEVLPESIAQSTGKTDKNDEEIYGSIWIDGKLTEGGDKIKCTWHNGLRSEGCVGFRNGSFVVIGQDETFDYLHNVATSYFAEIIHDKEKGGE
jgi:hypothetical protein